MRKLFIAAVLVFSPVLALAQAFAPNESRESLSQSIQKYRTSGNLSEAARSLSQAINLGEKTYGPRSREVAEDFDTLSDVLSEDAKYAEAETALKAALAIYATVEGPERTTNVFYVSRLASLVGRQQRFAEAERLYREVLAVEIREQGVESPLTLSNLAELYHLAKDYPKSEAAYRKILELESLEPGSGFTLGAIERLGRVYEEQGKFEQAEAFYRREADADQTTLPHGHLRTIALLNDLGLFYERRGRLQEAEAYYTRALEQFDGVASDSGLMDSNLATAIENYSRLLQSEGHLANPSSMGLAPRQSETDLPPCVDRFRLTPI
jgi:tetratricopeptide (TPR) repeat protein